MNLRSNMGTAVAHPSNGHQAKSGSSVLAVLISLGLAYIILRLAGVGNAIRPPYTEYGLFSPLSLSFTLLFFTLALRVVHHKGMLTWLLTGIVLGYAAGVVSFLIGTWITHGANYHYSLVVEPVVYLKSVFGYPIYLGNWILGGIVGLLLRPTERLIEFCRHRCLRGRWRQAP